MKNDKFINDPYLELDKIDFSIITSRMRWLPFFDDDIYLGMQIMNIGLIDSLITQYEYSLLQEWIEIEKTPSESAILVSALSQMWIFSLYEVLRMWRDRMVKFQKLESNGGIDLKLKSFKNDDPLNLTAETRRRQLTRFKEDYNYRKIIKKTWVELEQVYRMVEIFRMNLAKHSAPGKDNMMPRAPGYGRINSFCGSIDFELIHKSGDYVIMNRRDIADTLRECIAESEE